MSLQAIDVDAAVVSLTELHDLVLRRNGRVELSTRDGGTTVLLSKNELDALEQALDILSDTDEVRAMREDLSRVAAATSTAIA